MPVEGADVEDAIDGFGRKQFTQQFGMDVLVRMARHLPERQEFDTQSAQRRFEQPAQRALAVDSLGQLALVVRPDFRSWAIDGSSFGFRSPGHASALRSQAARQNKGSYCALKSCRSPEKCTPRNR